MRNYQLVSVRRGLCAFCFSGWGFVLLVLLMFSCKRSEHIQMESLYGRWDISKAERNGRETSYLRNGYFIINSDGTMTINITGEDETGQYTLEKNKLMMEGEKVFDIQSLQNDSLSVSYTASPESHFLFYMLKRNDDEE